MNDARGRPQSAVVHCPFHEEEEEDASFICISLAASVLAQDAPDRNSGGCAHSKAGDFDAARNGGENRARNESAAGRTNET